MTTGTQALLRLEDVCFGYRERAAFLGPVHFDVQRGELWGIVGPNGAGKSTLVRLMAGVLKPVTGRVFLADLSLHDLSLRARARRIGFLPQRAPDTHDLMVRDLVLMGRYPHRSLGLFESNEDLRIAESAMQRARVSEFADRRVSSLSGGEAQRAHLAAVFAQQTDLLLLDEPTASLDIAHQLEVFGILQKLLSPDGPAAVIVTHDVNLASVFCTHVLLLDSGQVVAKGRPSEVLTPARLQSVYEVPFERVDIPQGTQSWLIPATSPRTGP